MAGIRSFVGYVGFDPVVLKSAVVAHQGTDTSNLLADLTDVDIVLQILDQTGS